MVTKQPSFREGVAWIALNDSPGDAADAETIAGYISVALLADLFGKDPADVARSVVNYRRALASGRGNPTAK